MTEYKNPAVSIHLLKDTSPEKIDKFLDNGNFISDMNEYGLDVVISNKDTFAQGDILVPNLDNDGRISYVSSKLGQASLRSMYVRIIPPIKAPGSENIQMLNDNEIKRSASKYNLYEKVLREYQVPTHLLPIQSDSYENMANIIGDISTDNVVIKRNLGSGGDSVKQMSKSEAFSWLSQEIEAGNSKDHIVQPEIMFGRLPDDIRAIGTDNEKQLVKKARKEGLLAELRMFVAKKGDNLDAMPILRIVPLKDSSMSSKNDTYVDVDLSSNLQDVLQQISFEVINKAASMAGDVQHVFGSVDFYFDKDGMPRIMEANLRSPQLPITRENPIAGRAVHGAIAATLADMANNKGE